MNHLDSSNDLPRFDLEGEAASTGRWDPSEAAMTEERPAVRTPSRPAIRRIATPRPMSADRTDEVAVDQILLEAYAEPQRTSRRPPPLPMQTYPGVREPRNEVDALLSSSPASVAPVAISVPVPPPFYVQPQAIEPVVQEEGSRAGLVLAMAAVFVLTAAASFTLLAKPETLARVRASAAPHALLAAPPSHVVVPVVKVAEPPPRPEPMPTLTVDALPKPAIEKTQTLVTLPASAVGHRVFVDGAAVATSGNTMKTRCGRHAVKIGSHGKGRTLDLPCGAELVLE